MSPAAGRWILGGFWAAMSIAAAAQSVTQSAGAGQPFGIAQPGLAMRHVFVTNGLYPYRQTDYVQGDTMAMVRLWAGTTMPYGEPAADGTLLQVQQYAILNSVIGNTYGDDGLITIATPNLASRHAASSGVAPGGFSYIPGDTYGVSAAALTTMQMPQHRHSVGVAPDVLDTSLVGGTLALDLNAPTLTSRHVIAVDGNAPDSGWFPFVGMVRSFAGTYDTGEWLHADGRLLSVASYPLLFEAIGKRYGGDGTTTFALPDLRGRVPIGAGAGYPAGSVHGAPTSQLGIANLPSHVHSIPPIVVFFDGFE